jgi:hypothetical protein
MTTVNPLTPEGVDYMAELRAEIAEVTGPLVAHLERLDAAIEKSERDLSEMKKARQSLRAVVRGIDPSLVKPLYSTNGKKKTTHLSKEKLDKATKWLQARRDEINRSEGIYAASIIDTKGVQHRDDWDTSITTSGTTLPALFTDLHNAGILRLDHIGAKGRKIFKVV